MRDARHSGTASAVGPTRGRIRWRRVLEGNVTPGPVVGTDGTIYAASNAGVLHALDPGTGADRWTFDGGGAYGSDLSTSPAVLADGTILWPGPRNMLFGLAPDGRLKWSASFAGMVLSPAVATDGAVYVASMDGKLTRLDVRPESFRRRWSISVGTSTYGSPAIGPTGTIYTAADNDVVAVIDDGERASIAWRFDTGQSIETSPAVGADGTVVIGPNGRYEYAITASGHVRWRYDRGDHSYSSAVITPRGVAWFGDHRGFVTAVDVRTGRRIRRVHGILRSAQHRSVGVWTSPAVGVTGNVYFGTRPGHIYGFGADGRELFDIASGATVDSYPAITADGMLVIGSANATLYGIAD